jgi:hypothetical protein
MTTAEETVEWTLPAPQQRRRPARWRRVGAVVVVVALATSVLAVHDVGYMLHYPYWLDESWVADSIRAPLGRLPFLTSSTPLGWTLMLRLVPGAAHGENARLLPLFFSALAVVAGYVLGEELKLNRYLSGLLVGCAVLLAPAMLVRDDLKQYTAEAFAAVAILALVARLENRWSRRRLAALGGFVVITLLVSATNLFVGSAALVAVLGEAAIRRDPRRLVETLVAAVATGAGCLALYLLTVAPNDIPSLQAYWKGYYLSFGDLAPRLHERADQLARYMGFGRLWVVVVLAAAGVAGLAVARRWALAATVPLTIVIIIGAALAQKYPFGDERTSTFWLVMVTVVMAIAVAYGARWLSRRQRIAGPLLIVAALALWVPTLAPYLRSHSLPVQDIRDQVSYFARHYRAGDVLILNELGSYGFAYYYRSVTPTYVHDPSLATGFLPTYPHTAWMVQMRSRTAAAVKNALATATAKIDAEPPGRQGRIWIMRSEQTSTEARAWRHDLPAAVKVIPGHVEPLLLYLPSRP